MWPPDQAERLSSQAAALGPGELTRAAEVIAVGLTEMRGTTAPRLHLELMCARVLLPGADVDDRGIHARLDRLERRIGMTAPAAHEPPRAPTEAGRPAATTSRDRPAPDHVQPPDPRTVGPEPLAPPTDSATGPGSQEGVESQAGQTAADQSGSPADASVDSPADRATASALDAGSAGAQPARLDLSVTDVRRLWPEVLEEVKGKRRFTWILLSQNAQVAEVRDGTLTLSMANAGARDSFGRGGSEDILREALVVVLGADLRIATILEPAGDSRAAGTATTPQGGGTPLSTNAHSPSSDDRDAAAALDDADLDDRAETHAELLARHLGAEIIAEEDHGA